MRFCVRLVPSRVGPSGRRLEHFPQFATVTLVATMRERSPGVWEVRVFVGNDDRGRPKQVSRTVRGSKRDAQRFAAELTVVPPSPGSGRTVADVLEA